MKRSFTLLTLVALLPAALSTRAVAQSSYTVVDVGLLSGTAYNYPRAINNNPLGVEVVGTSMVKSGASYVTGHAFYWSQTAGIVDIGVIGTDVSSTVQDINAKGEVIGQSFWAHSYPACRPIYWNVSQGARNPLALATLGGAAGRTFDINDTGTIIGLVSDSTGVYYGVVWKPAGMGVYGLPTALPPLSGGSAAVPRAINNAGLITGGSRDAFGIPHACIWTPDADGNYTSAPSDLGTPVADPINVNTGMLINSSEQVIAQSDLGFFYCSNGSVSPIFDLNGGSSVYVTGLNDLGQAACSVAAGSATHAALWQNGTTYNLGTLGGTNSYAASSYDAKVNPVYTGFTINSSGLVVGYSQTTGNKAAHAFVWSSSLGMRDMNNLTPSKAGFSFLRDGTGINDSGVITGAGALKNGLTHAYVAFPKP
jgi:probable HAF family extracellular repeat protein